MVAGASILFLFSVFYDVLLFVKNKSFAFLVLQQNRLAFSRITLLQTYSCAFKINLCFLKLFT